MVGLCEAGVKSMKYHLKRIVGENSFTYEELSTLLCRIEAVLNSRPLVTSDYVDIITAGHFLLGKPLISAPEYIKENEKIGSLDRYRYIQRMTFVFWKKWKEVYFVQLQKRSKWHIIAINTFLKDGLG